MKKKSSTDYARERNYKQVTITFDLDDKSDATIYHYLRNVVVNKNKYLKQLVYLDIFRGAEQ